MTSRYLPFVFCVALGVVTVGLGEATGFADVAPPLEFTFGVTTGCGERSASAEEIIEKFSLGVRELTALCNAANRETAASGSIACPTSTCFAQLVPGGAPPPNLTVDITYTTSLSGSVSGMSSGPIVSGGSSFPTSGAISGGVYPSSGFGASSANQGLVVRVGLALPLGRAPDSLTCVSPISQGVRDALLLKIIDVHSRGSAACAGR